jgi:hypothetical protein
VEESDDDDDGGQERGGRYRLTNDRLIGRWR